jgi:arylsulfatase A-like enzyme
MFIRIALFLYLCFYLAELQAQSKGSQPNILFIAIDDLRPEIGCYGVPQVKTPHLDKLASKSFLFKNHYVTVPTCGASRYGLLTGNYPRTLVETTNDAIRKKIAENPERNNPESFIHALRLSGYYTVGIGKISHYVDGLLYGYTDPVGTELELPNSWDEMLFDAGKWGTGWNAFFGYADGTNRQGQDKMVKPYEAADVQDDGYPDGLTAGLAIEKIKELKQQDKPFFLGVGFFKPHLPFNAPQKYWDLYRTEDIPLTASPGLPEQVHPESLHQSGEFNHYQAGEEKASLSDPVSDEYARKLKHAYYACVSYIDEQVGKLLDELKQQGLDKNTIVVIWGDHGWHLGDHRVWGKHTNFEYALRSAFILKSPFHQKGKEINQIVSTVDLYPTLMELCNVPLKSKVDGESLVPMFKNQSSKTSGNTAFSYFKNGITMRTDRYRLTKYFRPEEPTVELYDYKKDPAESRNIAPENPQLVESLTELWMKGNTGIYQSP